MKIFLKYRIHALNKKIELARNNLKQFKTQSFIYKIEYILYKAEFQLAQKHLSLSILLLLYKLNLPCKNYFYKNFINLNSNSSNNGIFSLFNTNFNFYILKHFAYKIIEVLIGSFIQLLHSKNIVTVMKPKYRN